MRRRHVALFAWMLAAGWTAGAGAQCFTSAAAGGFNSVALRSDGTVWAWGINFTGQLGDGTNSPSSIPVQTRICGVVRASVGHGHALALRADGSAWSWGYGPFGELGNGASGPGTSSNVPVQVLGLDEVTMVAAGGNHSLALRGDGTIWAWGYNAYGALGDGSNDSSSVPVEVAGLTGGTSISAGHSHSLVVRSDGTVWAWGQNKNGELGNGESGPAAQSSEPVQVAGMTEVVAVAAGTHSSLALKRDGTVWAWGWNFFGQLGNGTSGAGTESPTPVQVAGLNGVASIGEGSPGPRQNWYGALMPDGTVWSWGGNDAGQLGNATNQESSVPVRVIGLPDAASLGMGYLHTVATRRDGSLWAWGSNDNGELGDGTRTNSNAPVAVLTAGVCRGSGACGLAADAGLPAEECLGVEVTLDGSGTAPGTCPGPVEYRWMLGTRVVRDWSSDPRAVVRPASTSTYRLEVRCGDCLLGVSCFDSAEVEATVDPDLVPPDLGNTVRAIRSSDDVELSWSPVMEARTYNLYRGTVKGVWGPAHRAGLIEAIELLRDVAGPEALYFYRLSAASCSGREGP